MKLTIFTPTYNRGYIINKLYQSLKRQTNFDFEWLVVDDGSTDNTEELFQQWIKEENNFPVRYYKKENGGKCHAINYALDLAAGELFFTVDSDDYLTDDAVEKILQWEKDLPEGLNYCGVAGNLGTAKDNTVNTLFVGAYYDGTLLDRYNKIDGERAVVIYTDIHRKYKYPEFENENFMTEAVAWNRMAADGYKMRFYNDIIWIYEYLDDGLTKSGNALFQNNPRGYGLWLREKARFENKSFFQKLMLVYTFTCELQHKYDSATIAQCIGFSKMAVNVMKTLHRIIRTIKRK